MLPPPSKTVVGQPLGFAADVALTRAMNPALGIRKLHQEGLTGKGVNVAIIDQFPSPAHPRGRRRATGSMSTCLARCWT